MTPLRALQTALAGEHASIYLYSVIGGRISFSKAPTTAGAIDAAYAAHRARRDQLQLAIRALGGEPVVPQVAYETSGPVDTTAQIVAEALGIETRCAEVYAQAVANTTEDNRRWAVDALSDAAVRMLSFGGRPSAFPGLPELT